MNINSRTVHFFELEVSTLSLDKRVPTPPQVPMSAILSLLAPRVPANLEIEYGSTPIEVTQTHWDAARGEMHILLNKADPERSDVAYRKRRTKARRSGDKQPDEDIEVSAHVLIKLDGQSTRAHMLITMGAKIPPIKLVSLFNQVYKLNSTLPALKRLRNPALPTGVTGSNGAPLTYKVNHRFSFRALPNQTLKGIISNGKIVGVNLISTGTERFDSSHRVNVDRMEMHVQLKAQRDVDVGYLKSLLKSARVNRNFDADKIAIEYTDVNSDDAEVKKKQLEVSQIEQAFTRSEKINLTNPHDDHQTSISSDIIDKMQQLV